MSNAFIAFSDQLADMVATAAAAVVRVEARRRLPATGIIWSADGLILTANHVVRKDDRIKIGLPDGESVPGQLIGRDPSTDLALVKVDAAGLATLTPAEETFLRPGHFVLALGRPGRTVQATSGIVSAVGKAWRTRLGGNIDHYLQTDVLMYPGYSGGPLVGAAGQLLGLNSSALSPGASTAVPVATLQRVANTLAAHGHMRRGYLGVNTQRVRLPQALRDELGQRSGLLIVSVEPDSPAEQGGLVMGDTIVAVGDTAVARHDDLMAQLSGDHIDSKVPMSIIRGGEVRTINVKVGQRP